MGGIKSIPCIDMATTTWEWCIQRNIWLSAAHIPGSENFQADKESRVLRDSTEWSLSQEAFTVWTTQPWFAFILNLLIDHPLVLPQSGTLHPFGKRVQLIACKVSENPSASELF